MATNPFRALDPQALRRRRTMKWQTYGEDVWPLWVAEMDLGCPPEVTAAVTETLQRGEVGYPYGIEYPEAFAGFARQAWGWNPAVAGMRQVNDVMTGVAEVLRHVITPGGPVVITPPVYPPFAMALDYVGARQVPAALGPEGRLDLETLEEALDRSRFDGSRPALLLASPHNPTGVVHTRDELTAVAELAERYGAVVVVDEIHAPLTYDGTDFVPYLSLPGTASGVVVTSAAKAWNIPGLKAALVVAGTEAAESLAGMSPLIDHGYATLGTVAHAAAYRHGSAWLAAARAGLAENRTLLGELLADRLPEVGYREPQATYLAWLDCRSLGLGDDPAAHFLEHAGVALGSGPDFGAPGAGFVRLNFATSPDILDLATAAMAASLDR